MFRLACVLSILLLTYQLVAQPADASRIISREEAPSNCSSRRTLFSIIWGCISTTIICGWAAIHPNIPPREGHLKGTLRRLELMFWTILAPEILPAWALNQLLAAMTVRNVYNKKKGYTQKKRGIWMTVKRWVSLYEIKEIASPAWTLRHGYFLIMGGFHVVEPPEDGNTTKATTDTQRAASDAMATDTDTERGRGPSENKPEPRVTILTLEMLRELVKSDPEFEILITEEEITDRSKGDALSKIIFILQSSWFIMQCLGRHTQGLALTHLELTTLALASLNGITFVLWWYKPLGAQAVVRVQMKRRLTREERNESGEQSNQPRIIPFIQGFFEGHVICDIIRLRSEEGNTTRGRRQSYRSRFMSNIKKFFGNRIRDIIPCRSDGNNIVVAWLIRLPYSILSLLLSPIIVFSFACFSGLMDLGGASDSFLVDATHVPTFYVPKHQYSEYFPTLLLMVLGTIFGAIHCAGWYFRFPTHTEQNLWHIASLVVTTIPIGIVFSVYIMMRIITKLLNPKHGESLVASTFVISMLAYAATRLVLLGLALALLRHPPQTAFTTVDWTTVYPHFL